MEGNLSAYRIFYTVAQKGNISYAAKELYISQPAISKAINKLEESLDTKLFSRSSRGVSLTEEGHILFEHIKEAFAAIKEGEESIKRMKELDMGQIRIGASTTLCKYVLIPYLKNFLERYPNIKITIGCQSTFHTMKLLEENKIDIGLIGKPEYNKDFNYYGVREIQDTFVTKAGFGEIGSAREIFSNHVLLLLDEENISRRYINSYFEEHEIETRQILEVSSMDLLIEFAGIGLGVACVIKEFVEEDIQQGILEEIPLKWGIKKREIGFAVNKKRILSPAINCFLKNL